jgi:hypothetical protein
MRAAAKEHRTAKRADGGPHSLDRLVGASGQQRWNATYYKRHRRKLYAAITERDRKNPDRKRARQRRTAQRSRKNLTDSYVRWRLTRGTAVKMSEWPAALVELKRAQLQGLRICKSHKTSVN